MNKATTFPSGVGVLATAAEMEQRRKIAHQAAKDWALDRIELLEGTLDALKWEIRMSPHGYASTAEMRDFLVAVNRFTATDTFAEQITDIENGLNEEAA